MDIVTKLFSVNVDYEPNTDTLKGLSKTLNSAGKSILTILSTIRPLIASPSSLARRKTKSF